MIDTNSIVYNSIRHPKKMYLGNVRGFSPYGSVELLAFSMFGFVGGIMYLYHKFEFDSIENG